MVSAAERVDVEQVALDDGCARGQVGLGGVADKGADIGAAIDELLDDLAADAAGGAGNEDGHGKHSWVGAGWQLPN